MDEGNANDENEDVGGRGNLGRGDGDEGSDQDGNLIKRTMEMDMKDMMEVTILVT